MPNRVGKLAGLLLLLSLGGCIRHEFDLCEMDPPHPECTDAATGDAAVLDGSTDAGDLMDAGDAGPDAIDAGDAGPDDAGPDVMDAGPDDAGPDMIDAGARDASADGG